MFQGVFLCVVLWSFTRGVAHGIFARIQMSGVSIEFSNAMYSHRNLFKKAYNVLKKSQIKLDVLVCAVRAAGGDADHQQVCIYIYNLYRYIFIYIYT